MKTKNVLGILFLLAIVIMVGCGKDEDPPILKVGVNPAEVVYNGSALLTWQGENLVSLTINGKDVSVTELKGGSMPLTNLTEAKTYNFVGIGLDGSTIIRVASIKVNKPVSKLSVTVTPNTEIPYKGSAIVIWKGENLVSLKINDVEQSRLVSDSIPLARLVKDTTFTFVGIGLDGSTLTPSALVKVAKPTSTDTLIAYCWSIIEWKSLSKDGYDYVKLTEKIKAEQIYYYKDGAVKVFDSLGKFLREGKWLWVGKDSIKSGTVTRRYKFEGPYYILSEKHDSTILTYKGRIILD